MENISVELNKEFKTINPEDRNELLKFFAKAYYYNDELLKPYAEGNSVYDDIEEELKKYYKPITEDILTILKKVSVKEGNVEVSRDIEAFFIIEQIMVGLKGKIGVTKDVIGELLKYHSKYNKEFITKLYMKELQNNVGNVVHIVGRHENAPFIVEGIINKVDSNNSISLDNYDGDIPFIGFKHYIIRIKNQDGKIIYNNQEKIDTRKLIDSDDIKATKHRILGVKQKTKKR